MFPDIPLRPIGTTCVLSLKRVQPKSVPLFFDFFPRLPEEAPETAKIRGFP
ncbi:hypothetical protein [Rhizobium sp. 18065]|uniref:hypothetical protein n=1 Tax=Rhizobium sp. 18065 TaxID=2681411 RepID=UPI0013595D17|nr:hypothetical protein [Rhizobium sp. 18065]